MFASSWYGLLHRSEVRGMYSTRLICKWSAWKLGSAVDCFIKTKYRNQLVFFLLLARGAGTFPEGETLELGGRKELKLRVNVTTWKQ